MSLCPDHGGYTGDACKKCQPKYEKKQYSDPLSDLSPDQQTKLSGPPKLDADDKFTLVSLENASLKSFHKMQNAQGQFQNFAATMFQKYGVKPSEYTLDMEKLEFVGRSL